MPKTNSRQGGFVAQNQGKIENCFSLVQVKGKGVYLGGFAGENSGEIKTSYAYSVLKGRDSGFIGSDTGKSDEKCYFFHDEKKESKTVRRLLDVEKAIALDDWKEEEMQYLEYDTEIWRYGSKRCPMLFVEESWMYTVSEASISDRKKIEISCAEDLIKWAEEVNKGNQEACNAYVFQTDDINLKGKNWNPIGSNKKTAFCGIFNGNGHTVKNFIIKDKKLDNQGFFGFLKGSVYNLSVDCILSGGLYAGGIAAQCEEGIIGCCSAAIEIKDADCIGGGLVGRNTGYIFQSYAAGRFSFVVIPWMPLGMAAGILAILYVIFFILIPSLENVPVYEQIDRDPTQIPIAGDVTIQKNGTNFISFQFEEGISVDLSTGLCTLHFKNPNASNHYVVVHLQMTDAVAKAVMGGTGRPKEEQEEIEAREGYDPNAYRVTIAESLAIDPGYQIDDLQLTEFAKNNLVPGTYSAIIYLVPYDMETNGRAMLESQLPVTIEVR